MAKISRSEFKVKSEDIMSVEVVGTISDKEADVDTVKAEPRIEIKYDEGWLRSRGWYVSGTQWHCPSPYSFRTKEGLPSITPTSVEELDRAIEIERNRPAHLAG